MIRLFNNTLYRQLVVEYRYLAKARPEKSYRTGTQVLNEA
jgi:hypothetical protein